MTTDNETVADVVREMRDWGNADWRLALDDIAARIEAANAREVEALQERIDNLEASGVHTCGVHCKRPVCVMRRRAEAAEAMSSEPGLLRLLVDLRFALGDNGKRMQDELLDFARELAADARRYRWIRRREVDVWRNKIVSDERADRFDRDTDAAIASGGEDRK